MRALWFALLIGCAEEGVDDVGDAENLALDEAPPPPVVTVTGSCPGPVTINLTGITPFAPWGIAASPNLGPGLVVGGGPCAGMALRVGPPAILAASGTANAAGAASFGAVLPPAACGQWIQPADLSACATGMFLQL